MSITLTNGLKLPDKGSVDWYADMQSNYAILDGAVGTVAEHTTQIAGKAPLVHTHTKSDITDFPAYGNTAGTICEGNDSRLSDARTPVAHTHGKADITDLFNSANVWTDTQTYSAASYGQKILLKNTDLDLSVNGNTGLSSTYQHVISWVDKNNTIYSSIQSWASDANNTLVLRSYYRTDANTSRNLSVRFVSTATDKSIYPETNADTNLGSASNQWNNLYAKNYYYNGTAWGLDKANIWSQSQTISANTNKAYIITNTSYTLGEETPSTTKELGGVFFKDSNGNNAAYVNVGHEKTTGDVYTRILTRFKFDNGVKSISGSAVNTALDIGLTNVGEKFVRPSVNNEVNLGTSSYKWKSFNGVNPGALSLPDSASFVDISSSITNLDGTDNFYTPSVNGWISVCVGNNSPSLSMYCDRNNSWGASFAPTNTNTIFGILPLVASNRVRIRTVCGALIYARFYPCLGNV